MTTTDTANKYETAFEELCILNHLFAGHLSVSIPYLDPARFERVPTGSDNYIVIFGVRSETYFLADRETPRYGNFAPAKPYKREITEWKLA